MAHSSSPTRPEGRGRVQFFLASGSRLAGFSLPGREVPRVTFDGLVLSGLGSLVYNGRSIFVSRPESGSLITELGVDGISARTFGELRATGHEQERDLHLALNSGLVVLNPEGGFYFVFVAGVPAFRKYDAAGRSSSSATSKAPSSTNTCATGRRAGRSARRPTARAPAVRPIVRAAMADAGGRLWLSLDVPYTYVYDRKGDKQRVVQLRAAGLTGTDRSVVHSVGPHPRHAWLLSFRHQMMLPLIVLAAFIAVWTTLSERARRKLANRVRADWGNPHVQDRRMDAIAEYYRSRAESVPGRASLDDRTWTDLDMDEVFAAVDRTESTLGQQALYLPPAIGPGRRQHRRIRVARQPHE